MRKEGRDMKLQIKAMRVREVLEIGSKEHETASKSNESGIEIIERKQETLNCN